jgi:hypothetical protein
MRSVTLTIKEIGFYKSNEKNVFQPLLKRTFFSSQQNGEGTPEAQKILLF